MFSEVAAAINRNFILPAYLRFNGDGRLASLRAVEETQWQGRDEIVERQFRDLRDLVSFAYRHVPYYRDKFDDLRLSPEDIRSPDDVKKIPILTKRDLQENVDRMVSEGFDAQRLYRDASGGSTGKPTIFYGDKNSLPRKFAVLIMSDKWTGWNVGEKSAYLWGADREVNVVKGLKHRFVERHVFRHEILNAFSVTEERMRKFCETLVREKPTLIVAYSNVAYEFARFLEKSGIGVVPPKGIVCSAETLSDEKRSVIEKVFGCKVLNRYGSREVGLIASECSCQDGLHVNPDVYVELEPLAEAHTGGERMGEVIVTDLTNRAMPLIRYNMGDLALFRDQGCGCGRGLPTIGHVTGRSSDFIVHSDGRLIHGEYFSHAFYGMPGILQFQIVQRTLDDLEINVVKKGGLSADERSKLVSTLRGFLGDRVRIGINEVDTIEVPGSGKFRFAISHVSKEEIARAGGRGGKGA